MGAILARSVVQASGVLGQVVSAEEAARIGLVNRVTETGKALEMAVKIASEIASRAPLAVREAKRVIDLAWDLPMEQGLAAELAASERVFRSEDMIEGAAAFLGVVLKTPQDVEIARRHLAIRGADLARRRGG